MTNTNRPLSPHLQVYKLPLTGLISITHRMTGVILSLGLIFFVYIVSAISAGIDSYDAMQAVSSGWPAKLIYWGFLYALFFHLCHGVRHLIWDAGKTFDKDALTRYAFYELAASVLLTALTFLLI